MGLGEAISALGAGVGLATSIVSGVGQVSNNPEIAQASIEAQAEIQSEGYECATDDKDSDD